MMTKTLALLPISLLACADVTYPAEPNDAPETPIAADPQTRAGDGPIVVATGGALAVAIHDEASIGWYGDATGGFAVEPYDVDGWPNTQKPEYWIRAEQAGAGSYAIQTNHGIASGDVASAPVARLALVPADYELDGHSPFALDVNRPLAQLALFDGTNRRLVDATVVLSSTGSTQLAWDRIQLAPDAGHPSVTASADSFDARDLGIDVVSGNYRVETVRTGDRTCLHAYAGNVEVATAMNVTANGGQLDPHAANCVIGAR